MRLAKFILFCFISVLLTLNAWADRRFFAVVDKGFSTPRKITYASGKHTQSMYLTPELRWQPGPPTSAPPIAVTQCSSGYCPCYGKICFNIDVGSDAGDSGSGIPGGGGARFSFPDSPTLNNINPEVAGLLEAARLRGQADGVKEWIDGLPKAMTPEELAKYGGNILKMAVTQALDESTQPRLLYEPTEKPTLSSNENVEKIRDELYQEFQKNPLKGAQALADIQQRIAENPGTPESEYLAAETQRLFTNGYGVLDRVPLADFKYGLATRANSLEGLRVRKSINTLLAAEGAINLQCSTQGHASCADFVMATEDLKRMHVIADRAGAMRSQSFDPLMAELEKRVSVIAAFAEGFVTGAKETLEGLATVVTSPVQTVTGVYDAIVNWEKTVKSIKTSLNDLVNTYQNGTDEDRARIQGRVLFEVVGLALGGEIALAVREAGAISKIAGASGNLVKAAAGKMMVNKVTEALSAAQKISAVTAQQLRKLPMQQMYHASESLRMAEKYPRLYGAMEKMVARGGGFTETTAEGFSRAGRALEAAPGPVELKRLGTSDKIAVVGRDMDNVRAHQKLFKQAGVETEIFDGPYARAGEVTAKDMASAAEDWDSLREKWGKIPDDIVETSEMYKLNQRWIEGLKKEGYSVIDLGNPKNSGKSLFYEMEKSLLID